MPTQHGDGIRAAMGRQAPMADQVVLGHLLPHYHAAQEWQATVRRMRDAGPAAEASLTAQERRARAMRTGRSATPGTSMTAATMMACRRWIGTRLIASGCWFARIALGKGVEDDGLITNPRRLAS